ncbi:MAG: hypothetical protein CVU81_00630 [Euryarchaeota archaeon HGW-Euryarchaeota-1]|nr:MAG: hypothetical protein CVU81_00630 [Euryarchaeota archaeon HGW-Euryarchaeota-1]
MSQLQHLPLRKVVYEAPRKKRPGYFSGSSLDFRIHAPKLQRQVQNVLSEHKAKKFSAGVDPSLILKIKLTNGIDENEWRKAGLTFLGGYKDKTLILFSSDAELIEFKKRLVKYSSGPKEGKKYLFKQVSVPDEFREQLNLKPLTAPTDEEMIKIINLKEGGELNLELDKRLYCIEMRDRKISMYILNTQHTEFFSSIDTISELEPNDRIGRHFQTDGIEDVSTFNDTNNYTIDVELWHTGNKIQMDEKVEEIRKVITSYDGRISDKYVMGSIAILRVKCTGAALKILFSLPFVSSIDLPPRVSLKIKQQEETGLKELGTIPSPPKNAAGICIIDSGITSGHPLLRTAIGEATAFPATMWNAVDENGHGTAVAGLALYGNISKCIVENKFVPQLQIYSARVVNKDGEFDDEMVIVNQMRNAITYFKDIYSCKVFNISQGDPKLPYNDDKVSTWASILDTLARELDILIVVAAGNYDADEFMEVSKIQRQYPNYLLDPSAKIIEPSTGCNVITVGSIADNDYLSPLEGNQVNCQPIAKKNQPSPFTRSGFGISDSIKPDVIECGGNWAHNGTSIIDSKELSILSLNKDYLNKLFTTDVGTSLAAPRVAYIAAQLFNQYPDKSANFVRALIASSCTVPAECVSLLENLGDKNAILKLCGYGVPNLDAALLSDINRVVMYAEGYLPFDMFHIYEVPIPESFINTKGKRKIAVTLAFDPPVRHSRLDYLGTNMSFCLIRGKSVEEVKEAFKLRSNTDRLSSTVFDCKFEPTKTIRSNGTLQKGEHILFRSPDEYGDTYFLVVNCQRNWAPDEFSPQKFAVVVTISHEAPIDLYAQIKARLELPIQIQARI